MENKNRKDEFLRLIRARLTCSSQYSEPPHDLPETHPSQRSSCDVHDTEPRWESFPMQFILELLECSTGVAKCKVETAFVIRISPPNQSLMNHFVHNENLVYVILFFGRQSNLGWT